MSTEEKTVEEPKLETVQAAPRVQPAPRATHRHAETTAPRWTSLRHYLGPNQLPTPAAFRFRKVTNIWSILRGKWSLYSISAYAQP